MSDLQDLSRLALNGGSPVRNVPFPQTITTGIEEIKAATSVLQSGLLSGFVGSDSAEFLGGVNVQSLENEWSEKFEVRHTVSCNSATSALIMAIGACGISPGDEVIVSPYTMSATAMAVLIYGGIPVFADIEPEYFCLDPHSVRARITKNTKLILTTDIHGQSSDIEALRAVAREFNLCLVIDCSQSPGARYKNGFAGTGGDIGVFSLNRHKNIQCGEGGIAVTNDPELALRMQLIRNHGENLISSHNFSPKSLVNIVGFNLRMPEVEASIAREQLKKLEKLNQVRLDNVKILEEGLSKYPGLLMPAVRSDSTHVYYMHAMKFIEGESRIARADFVRALASEGVPIRAGYVRPLYLEPIFQKKIAIGSKGFPFIGDHYDGTVSYEKGICPVAENLFDESLLINPFVYPPLEKNDMLQIIKAVDKVYLNSTKLK